MYIVQAGSNRAPIVRKMLRLGLLVLSLSVSATALVSPFSNSGYEVRSRSRRDTLCSIATVGAFLIGSQGAVAASQEEIDKANIVKGYKRLSYLLDNWEEKTTNCK